MNCQKEPMAKAFRNDSKAGALRIAGKIEGCALSAMSGIDTGKSKKTDRSGGRKDFCKRLLNQSIFERTER